MSSADDIEDELSDFSTPSSFPSSINHDKKPLPVRKRRSSTEGSGFFSRSQKFRKKSDQSKIPTKPVDERPWTTKYQPASLDEVAVHRKKATEVREWLQRGLTGRSYQSLLLLKGPAGSGKSALLQALAQVMGLEILAWKNPESEPSIVSPATTVAAHFDSFVHTSRKFATLDLVQPGNGQAQTLQPVNSSDRASQVRQLLVIEEFPNTFARSSKNLQAFRSTILQYLAAHRPTGHKFTSSSMQTKPSLLVIVISEALVSNSTSFSDSFTAHRLLGPEILNNPRVTTIEFNQIAPTLITKALKLVLEKHHKLTGQLYAPNDQILQRLAEMGDVRNAISGLEFFCKQTEDLSGRLSGPSKRSKTKMKAKTARSKLSSSSIPDPGLSVITQRDSTLTLFHAIGKVLHNKRLECRIDETSLPPHLVHHARPHPPENDPENLLSTAGTDIHTFLAALHENYLFSCYHPSGNSLETLESTLNAIEALSSADILSSIGRAQNQYLSPGVTGASEGLRQAELAFTAGLAGVMFGLPHPVKRQTSSAGNANKGLGDAHRMYYPTSQRIWREQEEVHGVVEQMIHKHYSGGLAIARRSAPVDHRPGTGQAQPTLEHIKPSQAESQQMDPSTTHPNSTKLSRQHSSPNPSRNLWARPQPMPLLNKHTKANQSSPDHLNDDPAPLGSDLSPTRTLLLTRLPYLAQILRTPSSYPLSTPSLLQTIERVTRFPTLDPTSVSNKIGSAGTAQQQNSILARRNATSAFDDDSDGEDAVPEHVSTRGKNATEMFDAVGGAVEGLVLSEDDIEDSEAEAAVEGKSGKGSAGYKDDEDDEFGSDVEAGELDLG